MSHRIEQLQSTLLRAVQEVIARGLQDPRAGGLITVTDLLIAPDLRNATVMVSVYPAEKQSLTMHALKSAAAHIRRKVGDLVAMRQVPQLSFKLDESLKRQAQVLKAISEAGSAGAEGAGTGGAPKAEENPD